MTKKGQGLPLNTIIIAIIVLVVLVVLIAIFTGRIAIFDQRVSEIDKTDLIALKVGYGACYPDANAEQVFLTELSTAKKTNDANDDATARAKFQKIISDCASNIINTGCTGTCTGAR